MEAKESRGAFGVLILQHHGWRDQAYNVEERSCILATRALKRDVEYEDGKLATGGYDLDRFATGDLTNVFAWRGSQEQGGRYIAGFSWAWAAIVTARRPSQTTQQQSPPASTPAQEDVTTSADPRPPLADPETGAPVAGADTYPPRQTDPTDDTAGGAKDSAQESPDDFYVLPIRNDKFEEDTRYEPIKVAVMADAKGAELVSKYPPGTRGIVLAGSEENEQFGVFVPCDNRLLAVNYGGDPFTGTLVSDLGLDGKLDTTRQARLQSHLRVIVGPFIPEPDVMKSWEAADPSIGGTNVLAWNLGGHAGSGYDQLTGRNDSFAGWIFMDGPDAFEGGGPHLCREEAKGPFAMGCCVKHRLAVDGDNNPIFPLHQALGTLWTFNHRYRIKAENQDQGNNGFPATGSGAAGICGPLLFEGGVRKVTAIGPYVSPVHLRFDPAATHDWFDSERQGVWRWQADTYFEEPDKPDTPDTPTDNPPWEGPPDDGQPPYPGKIPPEDPDEEDPGFGFVPPFSIPDAVDRARRGLPPIVYPPIGPNGPLGPVIDPDGFPFKGGDGDGDGGPAEGGSGGDIVPAGKPPADNTSPGRLRELGWWGNIRPGDAGLAPTQTAERNRFVATGIMTSFPGFLIRPQLYQTGAPDMRHWMTPTPEAVKAFDLEAPVVLRMEGWGAQGGPAGGPYLDTATGRVYTNKPRTARYPSGDGPGGLAFLTPQTDLSLIDSDLVAPTEESPSYVLVGPNVRFAAGLPELSGGGVKSGWAWGADAAGDLIFEQFGPDGESLQTVTFPPAGGSSSMAAIFGQTADATVGGTGAETTLIGTGVGAPSVPADSWFEGMSTRTLLRGRISTIAPTPGAITIKGKIAGATVLTAGAAAITANLNTAEFEIEMVLTCRDLSTPSAAVFAGSLTFKTIGITGVPVSQYVVGTTAFTGTVDTTADMDLDITWTWGTSSGGNTLTTTVGKTDTETPS